MDLDLDLVITSLSSSDNLLVSMRTCGSGDFGIHEGCTNVFDLL